VGVEADLIPALILDAQVATYVGTGWIEQVL
jgi:hypothetical protein